ncbi:MAG: gamma-glutamyltransferase family protein [Hyphomicrobiaceae bacterium]
MMPQGRRSNVALALLLLASFAAPYLATTPAHAQAGLFAPEAETGWQPRPATHARRHMVATANLLASRAAREQLRAGGSAVDAAIAAQLVLGLVEPQSSGLGGGAFLLHFDAPTNTMVAYDGREAAPAAAMPDRFLAKGRPMPFRRVVKSSLSIGVPGTVRLLEAVHRRHGRRPWQTLFADAIKLAETGFAVSPRLHSLLATTSPAEFTAPARAYFYDASGRPWPAGHILRNPAYAATLKAIASSGAAAFYDGPLAHEIVAASAVQASAKGQITLSDLSAYRVIERKPLCVPYRTHQVCSMGPPSSGAHTLGQVLLMLGADHLGDSPRAAMAPRPLHLLSEALKLAFADRNWYLADPAFVPIPSGLLDRAYLAERRSLIPAWRPVPRAYPGRPPGSQRHAFGRDATHEASGTSHISIIDAAGNAVAMTTTIESGFGSGRWAGGFLLNNELTDFSFRPKDRDGRLIANRVEGGKRPRSSMSPAIVLDQAGKPVIVTGSAGGSRIIGYVLKTLIAVIDWKLDAASALALPNFGSTRDGPFDLEGPQGGIISGFGKPAGALGIITTALRLKPLDQTIALKQLTSGTQLIIRRADGHLEGAADPRREGAALGD